MSERFVIAALLFAGVLTVGLLVRYWSGRRNAAIIDRIRLEAAIPTILAFSGPGCDACAVQKRILTDLSSAAPTRIDVQYLDAVGNPNEARQFGVMVVPTTVVAGSDGQILAINTGLVSAERLTEQLAAAGAAASSGSTDNADEWFQSSPWALV